MKYTKQQRADMVKVFRLARQRIENGSNSFICHALDAAAYLQKVWATTKAATSCKRLVRSRLGSSHTYEIWLFEEHPEITHEVISDIRKGGAKARAARIAWLDSLIEEFSK